VLLHSSSDFDVELCQSIWIGAACSLRWAASFANQEPSWEISFVDGWRQRRGHRRWKRGRPRGWRSGWRKRGRPRGWRSGGLQRRGLLPTLMPDVVVIGMIFLLACCMECPPMRPTTIYCGAIVRLLAALLRLLQRFTGSSAASCTESIAAPLLMWKVSTILRIVAHPVEIRLQPFSGTWHGFRTQAETDVRSDTETWS